MEGTIAIPDTTALQSIELSETPLSEPAGAQLPPLRSLKIKADDGTLSILEGTDLLERVANLFDGLDEIDADRIVRTTLRGLYDGCPEHEVPNSLIRNAAALVPEEPAYSFAAARLLDQVIVAEVLEQGIKTFGDCIIVGHQNGLIDDNVAAFVAKNAERLDAAIRPLRGRLFGYFGLQTIYDRYLLKHPQSRKVVEMPQYFFMRVACGLARDVDEALEMYNLISKLDYLPSSPTLFNSATRHMQMSSCYLLDSPADELDAIYSRYTDIAQLSKYSGGIGVAYHRVRARGSLIKGTNGHSNGIVPWLKTLDSSVAAVNQGGRRKGACCVYLETWHADIEEFLELRENTGDIARRTHNLNLANWVPDLFMKRVLEDGTWSLFSPLDVPHLTDLWGDEFEAAYEAAERDELFDRQVSARKLYGAMMRCLAQTGQGWMTFKDACNRTSNQTANPKNVVHSSNLCTEIVEITNQDETAVCNLGSVNLSRFITPDGQFDFDRLRDRVAVAVKFLDRVVDINYYPTPAAKNSNLMWRPVGLGIMGLQDVMFKLRLPFDGQKALDLSNKIQEEVYFQALTTSCDLAESAGAHKTFADTRAAQGELQFDSWGVQPSQPERWDRLRQRITEVGLRNSLLIAIAPTATIASISGCYECTEPMVSNLFRRETLSGDFLQVNIYLVADLKKRGLWNEEVRDAIKRGNGSIQHIESIPEDLRYLYRTAWELSQKPLINLAAGRGAYIDQSQSLNLFMETPTIGKLSSMYMYAWQQGVKTTYYLRSRPATRIRQTTTAQKKVYTEQEKLVCSLENPEYCEACQ
ncbi:MAG TPA: ribonucleoside-diphosphate reductase subunit alpha [Myxococcales bacterium]|nr:ribonucleoside-diphosphate reductase subunit alpha [Myxococcales bacterium]HAN31084.1 ribonucleoside-diphosphate reductase subunit alpha [Myxococcales bacterium]